MIKITPYYEMPRKERDELLNLYLEMVAIVVPFFRCDVLNLPTNSTIADVLRRRTEKYLSILQDYRIDPRIQAKAQDAMLARKLIKKYSLKLHDYLYAGIPDESGHVNRNHLHRLLTLRMVQGELPEDILQFCGNKTKKDLLLSYVFRFKEFSSNDQIYQLLKMLGVEVCPYCNRQYITTVANGKRKTRPQLDHFKNKNQYPFLALSINNLVPCCGVCNLLKHDNNCNILYPYEEEMGMIFCFSTSNPDGIITSLLTGAQRAASDFEVELKPSKSSNQGELEEKAKASIDQMALDSLYQSHRGYITDLYFQRYIHTDEYMEEIIRQFPSLFIQNYSSTDMLDDKELNTVKEVLKRNISLMDYRQEAWGKRPLSKLTHDIMEEIDERIKGVNSKRSKQ